MSPILVIRYVTWIMAQPTHIVDATPENFEQLVLENSRRGPVLVNYWAPWAGPCLKLWPVLEKLAGDYAGRFLLVNVNTDRYKQLANAYAVNSLPTLKVFRNGRIIDEVRGAESEASLRAVLERHLPRPSDRLAAAAVQRFHQGEKDVALDQLAQIAADDPDNRRVILTYAKLAFRQGEYRRVQQALRQLPKPERSQGEAADLLAHAGLMLAAEQSPSVEEVERALAQDADDLEAYYARSGHALLADEYEVALQQLLAIVSRDPAYRDGAAISALNAIFHMLGSEHELSRRYRSEMLNILH